METIEFIGIITVALVVAGWYFYNEEKGRDGEIGLLALKPDAHAKAAKKKRSYRIKPRSAARARGLRTVADARAADAGAPAYRKLEDTAKARRRFRRQDEARYLVKDRKSDKFRLRNPED